MPLSGKRVVKLLLENGWRVVSQKGSHVKLRKDKKLTIVPIHSNKDLPKGTLKSIEKQTGVKLS